MRKMGLEPTRPCEHKILSLARLPVPTLPHLFTELKCSASRIIQQTFFVVNTCFVLQTDLKRSLLLQFDSVPDEKTP